MGFWNNDRCDSIANTYRKLCISEQRWLWKWEFAKCRFDYSDAEPDGIFGCEPTIQALFDDVTITGTSSATLTVTPPNQNVAATGGTTPFTVTTAAAWTASSDAAWCTVTPSGTGNGTLTATFTLNSAATSRVANITVTATGAPSVTVTVTQAAGTANLIVTPSNQNVTSPSGNASFTVTSNVAWTVVSDAAWCTVTPIGTGNGTITATFTQNTTTTSRVANITVTATGIPSVTVTVTQANETASLAVTPSNQNVSSPAGNTSLTVTSNAAWTVASDSPWCTVTLSGSGNGTISVTYSQNPGVTQRIASIMVTVSGISPVIVTLTQYGQIPVLLVTPSVRNVGATASTVDYTVASNTDWTALADSSWCIVTPSGSGNGTITASYNANPYGSSRITSISVMAWGVSTQVVKLIQGFATETSLEDMVNGVRVYPNPTTGIFCVVVDKSKYPDVLVTISDAKGSMIMNRECKGERTYFFDLGKAPQGTYSVRIKTGTELLHSKLILIR